MLSNMMSSQIFISTKVIAMVPLHNYAVYMMYAQLLNGINHGCYVNISPICMVFM